jgi:hypothetical protein
MLICTTFREKSYRFLIGNCVCNLGTIHNVRQRILLQSRLGRISDSTGSQAHDTIANFEGRDSISNPAHDSNDILAEYGRELVCDEEAGVSASLIVRVETWRTASVIRSCLTCASVGSCKHLTYQQRSL